MNLAAHLFTPEDFGKVEPAESPYPIAQVVAQMQPPETCIRTLTLEGVPRAIAGVQERWPGVGDAWVWYDDTILERHRWSFARLVKYELMPISDARFHRVTAPVDVDNPAAVRFIEWLGFHREFESPLRDFGLNGKGDYWQYVRFH